MNSLTGALAAARRGWPVFPLRQGEKRPRVTEWETVATTSPDRIWWWWRRHPDDNVAIATGPAGLVVVDLDLAGPDEEPPAEHPGARGGLDVFAALAAEHGYVSGDKGQPLAAWTAGRYRKNAHTCIRRAVELGRLPVDPWPPTPRGRNRRKARRKRQAVDVRRLPDPYTMAAILTAIRSHQPGSRNYQVMMAVTYNAGLRPSETAMLRPRALDLPDEGWGAIHVVEADDGWDEPAEPKTGERTVPIPPELVALLRAWIDEHGFGADDLLFRTRNRNRPTQSNWGRALKRACRAAGFRPLTPYDGRHACATTWLRSGVPLGEAARRLGHTVETPVSTYVGALDGDDIAANKLIDEAVGPARAWMAAAAKPSSRVRRANSSRYRSKRGNNGENDEGP